MAEEKSIAERLHDSYVVQELVEDTIAEAFKKFEPQTYNLPDFEFSISSDLAAEAVI